MATIIRATGGVPGLPPGFPILVDNAMRIVEPAFAYLMNLAIIPGRSHATETVRTYAEHLHDWFDTLEQSGLDWRDANERTIAAYRNRMLETPSRHTGRPHARATINARVHTVCRFYAWAYRRGLIGQLPFNFVEVRTGTLHEEALPAYLGVTGDARLWANVLTVPQQGLIPRPLQPPELARLLAVLGQPYRLMAEWAVTTGLRRKELCALTTRQVPSAFDLDPERDPFVAVKVTQTKGGRPRMVYPPLKLLDRTHWYMGEERAMASRLGARSRRGTHSSSMLFLRPNGSAPTHASVSAVFGRAFRGIGLGGSLHMLRHTFAITMLAALHRRARIDPDLNPLKVLQVLLGHTSIETTAIYVRCVELHAESLADSVDHLYGALITDVTG